MSAGTKKSSKNNAYVDNQLVYMWALEFFKSNPGASINLCTRRMVNARLPPVTFLIRKARFDYEKTRPNNSEVSPSREDVSVAPVTPITEDIVDEILENAQHHAAQTEALMEETNMAPVVTTKPKIVPSEDLPTMMRAALQQLQHVMRVHNLATVIISADDTGPKFSAEVEQVKKSTDSYKIEF